MALIIKSLVLAVPWLIVTQLSNDIDDTTADLQFVLNWPAAPYELSTGILSGSIDAHLAYGRILGVDPGLGRVLGALDIWKIGERLRFDFSDITDSGLSFSETTGHFTESWVCFKNMPKSSLRKFPEMELKFF
jgi:uncharacterized protein YhdP